MAPWAHRPLPRAGRRQPRGGRVAPRAGPSHGLRGQAPTQPAVHFYAAAPVHFYAAVDIPSYILGDALQQELREGTVVADAIGDRGCVFLGHLWNAEKSIAERLRALASGKPSWPRIDADKAIPWVERKLGVTLARSQREAIKKAVSSKVMVITGGPGVGKTTLVNAILRILVVKDARVALAAPTGRAAKRLSESTGLEAKTIHRLLEADPRRGGFKRTADDPLE